MIKQQVDIKPLSVNKAWQGKRYKSKYYSIYEKELFYKLESFRIPNVKIGITFIVGYSNVLSDIDNFLKPFIDVMQKKYDINDKNIYELNIKKEIVKKGCEFVDFQIYFI
jgi:Holliday junction resolvase RusA-like endonuclease